MRNIRKFETFEDFLASQESVSGTGKYVEDIWPGFAYVKEKFPDENFAIYNGVGPVVGDYKFGDVVFYDETDTLKNIYWEDCTPDMGTPIAVVVAEAEMMPDGIARIVPLENVSDEEDIFSPGTLDKSEPAMKSKAPAKFMRRVGPKVFEIREKNEENGEKSTKLLLGASANLPKPDGYWFSVNYDYSYFDENQYYYDGFAIHNESEQDRNSTVPTAVTFGAYFDLGGGSVSSDYPGEYCDNPLANPNSPNEYYDDESGAYTVSPYTAQEGQLSPSYTSESGTDSYDNRIWNGLSDFSGFTWSKMMSDEGQTFCTATVNAYKTSGTSVGDWYVPALGESMVVAARWKALCGIFQYLGYQGVCEYDGLISSTVLYGGCGIGFASWFYGMFIDDINVIAQIKDGAWAESYSYHVRPMAMIRDGKIVKEYGTPVANGHQIKDISGGGVSAE